MSMSTVDAVSLPVIDLKATGKNIMKMRKNAGIPVRDLQAVLGFTTPQAIYKWQNGECLPTIDNLVILAAVFGVTVDDILVIDGDIPEDGFETCKLFVHMERAMI